MKKNIYPKIALIFLSTLTMFSCTKDGLFDYSGLEHTAEWLFPVVKTKITAEQVSKLNGLKYDVGAFTVDAPFITTTLPVPPISGQSIGPIDLDDTDSIYVQFKSDTATLKVYITNNFPINIKAGTVVEIRNSINNTNVVFDGTIQNDIPAKGGVDSVIVTKVITTPWADNKLKLFLTNFGSDGSATVENFNTYNNIDVKLGIEVIHLNEVELYGNIDYLVTDTSDFEFGSDPSEPDEENIESAKLNLFIENGIPLTYSVRGYFLDANYSVLDSLFGTTVIPAPGIDGSGYVINSTIVEDKIVSQLTKLQYVYLKNNTKHIFYQFQFTSQPQHVRVIHPNHIKMQVTADIKTKVSL